MTLEILLQKKDKKMQLNSCLLVSVLCSSWPGECPPDFSQEALLCLQLRLMLHFLSLALNWIDLLPHVRELYLPDEWMCLRAGHSSEIAPFSPSSKQTLLKELCRGCTQICGLIVPKVEAYRSAFLFLQGESLENNVLNVQGCFFVLSL